ncbi:MAG: hypothetical protein KGL57_00095 [Burkholderiales bacterium]|nr:hypothetical protein [Burkholderiales bacterium]
MLSRLLLATLGAAALSSSAMAATNVGVSVSVNQPGFYGRIDLGDQPPPLVIYPQPVIIEQRPVYYQQRPIYLRVPPGHSKDWARYCGRYQACNQPVYFVRDDDPRWGSRHERDDRDDRRDYRERRDDDDDRGHGRGHDHGRGHGHGHDRD